MIYKFKAKLKVPTTGKIDWCNITVDSKNIIKAFKEACKEMEYTTGMTVEDYNISIKST